MLETSISGDDISLRLRFSVAPVTSGVVIGSKLASRQWRPLTMAKPKRIQRMTNAQCAQEIAIFKNTG